MLLLLTGVLPFLGHNHASAVAFLTCRYHNFHGSIIPEFLSDEERVKSFCDARQQNELGADKHKQYANLYNLFVQIPLMQFSPSLLLYLHTTAESILMPLLETQYFSRTLQRCTVEGGNSEYFLQNLSKVQSLTEFDLGMTAVENTHVKSIVNSFLSLETLTINCARCLEKPAIQITSPPPPPPATKTLRNLTMKQVDPLFATQFIPHFTYLRKLVLSGYGDFAEKLDLLPLSSSLLLLTSLSLECYTLENVESLKTLGHLSTLYFSCCKSLELSFLSQKTTILPELIELSIEECDGLSNNSFASLTNAPYLCVLKLNPSAFNNDCLQYLEHMIHLRKLDLSHTKIVGDSRSLQPLMRNLFQLEELNLEFCRRIGNQGAIAGALYSTHSHLRVLNLSRCDLVDDDLNGIGQLQKKLEVLDLSGNIDLTNKALVHCKDLVKLKKLNLTSCFQINDLSPLFYYEYCNVQNRHGVTERLKVLKGCLKLEELDVSWCDGLTDDSFKVFSEEPNSFPNLRLLNISFCDRLTENVFEHFSKNNHLVYQLKELNVEGMSKILAASETARKNICQLKGLRQLRVTRFGAPSNWSKDLELELLRELKNLEGF